MEPTRGAELRYINITNRAFWGKLFSHHKLETEDLPHGRTPFITCPEGTQASTQKSTIVSMAEDIYSSAGNLALRALWYKQGGKRKASVMVLLLFYYKILNTSTHLNCVQSNKKEEQQHRSLLNKTQLMLPREHPSTRTLISTPFGQSSSSDILYQIRSVVSPEQALSRRAGSTQRGP